MIVAMKDRGQRKQQCAYSKNIIIDATLWKKNQKDTENGIKRRRKKTKRKRSEKLKRFHSSRLLVTMWFGRFFSYLFHTMLLIHTLISFAAIQMILHLCMLGFNYAINWVCACFIRIRTFARLRLCVSVCFTITQYSCRIQRRRYERARAHFAIQIQVFEYTAFDMTSRYS